MNVVKTWINPVRRLPDGTVISHEEFLRRRLSRPAGPPIIFYEDRRPRKDEYEYSRIVKDGLWLEVTEELPEEAAEGEWCLIQDEYPETYCWIQGRWEAAVEEVEEDE